MDASKVTRLPGRWTPLPPHGGAGEIRHVAVATREASVFLAITSGDGPRILHGRLGGESIEWSRPWLVPLAQQDTLAGVELAIDELDPLRIAVNRLEDQGGSFGITLGRWAEPFLEVPSTTDSDLPFGSPMILRGSELFTHDRSSFLHVRIRGARAIAEELSLTDAVDELGADMGIDASGRLVALSAFGGLLILEREDDGDLQLHRHVPLDRPIDALEISPGGATSVVLDRPGSDAFDVLTYDRDGHAIDERTVTTPAPMVRPPPPYDNVAPSYALHGHRVVRETADGFFVFDLRGDRHVRLVGSGTVPWPPPTEAEIASSAWRDTVVLASREGVGVYSLARTGESV
jgi:hypothetical protein